MRELPLAGDEFAGYRLRAVLGRGGAGAVYEAESPRLGTVALKVLAPELGDDDVFRMRFLAESRIAASLEHPHVIPIHDVGSSDGLLYIVMRRVPGTDLRQMIAERGRPRPAITFSLLSQAAEALDAAHRMGLVHRSVKPGSLLIEEGDPGHLYVADFGISKRAGLNSAEQLAYVAPEQISGLWVYGSADQYSLGCVLYECLTGRTPFEKNSEEHPTPLQTGLPPEMDEVFARVLAEQPGDRYNTCREFMRAACAALGDMAAAPPDSGGSRALAPEPAAAPPEPAAAPEQPSGEQPADGSGPRSGWLRARWLMIAAALLLICAGAGAYAALSPSAAFRPKAADPTSSATATKSAMPRRAPASMLMQVLTAADASKVAMGKLPPSSCVQQSAARISCGMPWPGIISATFTTYPTLGALYSAYEARVRSLNSGHYRENVKDCGLTAPTSYGEIAWNHREQHSRAHTIKAMIAGKVSLEAAMGRMACVATGSHSEDIVWTTDYGKMLGVAIGTGPHAGIWYWWADVHHNIVFPGTPMDMGGKAPLMSGAPMPGTQATGSPSMPASP
jgi:serine/threonine protein kinase